MNYGRVREIIHPNLKGCSYSHETIVKSEQEAVSAAAEVCSQDSTRARARCSPAPCAPKRVVITQQLAGLIRPTFSSLEKQPGSLRALLALKCTFFLLL